MLRGQLWSSKGNVSISVVSTVSESHDTQTMKHRKSHPLEIKQWEHNQCNSFIVQIVLRNGSSKWRIWGLEKLRQLPNKNQNLIGFWYIFTMRESTEVETQQLADCVILPSNTSYSLVNKTQQGTGMERPPGQPRVSKAPKAAQPPPCSPAGFPTLCLARGSQCSAAWTKGTSWWGKGCATSAWGAADRAELQIQDLLGGKPWAHLGITSGIAAHKALLQLRLLPSVPVLCRQLGKGRWKPQWLSPCSRACDSANVSTWSDLHREIRTKQMLLAQTWLIRHLSGSASTTTRLRWLQKANGL